VKSTAEMRVVIQWVFGTGNNSKTGMVKSREANETGTSEVMCPIPEVNVVYRRMTPVLRRGVSMSCDRNLGDRHVHTGAMGSPYPNLVAH
jgi:hypothetical protein